jgi:hypothetical protein
VTCRLRPPSCGLARAAVGLFLSSAAVAWVVVVMPRHVSQRGSDRIPVLRGDDARWASAPPSRPRREPAREPGPGPGPGLGREPAPEPPRTRRFRRARPCAHRNVAMWLPRSTTTKGEREKERATHFRRLDRKEAAGAGPGPGPGPGAGDAAAGAGVEARTEATADGAPVVAVGMTRLERDGLRLFDAPRARLGIDWCVTRHTHNTTQHDTTRTAHTKED